MFCNPIKISYICPNLFILPRPLTSMDLESISTEDLVQELKRRFGVCTHKISHEEKAIMFQGPSIVMEVTTGD